MNKNIIIAILVVIIIAVGAALMFGQSNAKTETQINIISDDSVQNGEQVQFELKDTKGNAISGQDLNITFNNQKYTMPTDQNGKAYLTISGQSAGSYDVSAEYGGNDKYDGCTAKTKITITDGEPDNPATQTDGNSVQTTDDTDNNNDNNNNNNNGSNDNPQSNSSDYPFPGSEGTYNIPEYGLWVRSSDNVVIDSYDGTGIGLTVGDWIAKYGDKYHYPDTNETQ